MNIEEILEGFKQIESMFNDSISEEKLEKAETKEIKVTEPEVDGDSQTKKLLKQFEDLSQVSEKEKFEEELNSITEEINVLEKDNTFRYMMLDRLKQDCNYFLGNGNRNEKHLWAGDVDKQIKLMKDLYNSFEEKPEWISMEDIENFEKQMKEEVNESTKSIKEDELTWEQVEPQVKEAVEKYKKEHAHFFKDGAIELTVDYSDTLDEKTIEKIFDSNTPKDAFYDEISEWEWFNDADMEYDYIYQNLDLTDDIKEQYRPEILQYLSDSIPYIIPYDHFDETVGFDVFLHDADSANREYQDMLEFVDTDEQDEDGDYKKELDNINGMLEKFLKSQGYTKEQFIEYYNEDKSGDTFLDSVISEINETNYGDGRGCQIVFLVQAPITAMGQAMQEGGNITIPVDAECGLVNCGNGSGGTLEIKLKNPVSGSIKEAGKPTYSAGGDFEVYYKHGYSYNVDEIYGLVNSAWEADAILNTTPEAQQESVKEEKTEVVAQYECDGNKHDIVKKGKKYHNRYHIKGGKPRTTTQGVDSLPTAVGAMNKKFPNAEEVK